VSGPTTIRPLDWLDETTLAGRWPHVDWSVDQVASADTGALLLCPALVINLDRFERLRQFVGQPIKIDSCYRTAQHNRAVKGWSHSQHLRAEAIDLRLDHLDPRRFRMEYAPIPPEQMPVWTNRPLRPGEAAWVALTVGGWPRCKVYSWGSHLATYGPREPAGIQVDAGIPMPHWAAMWGKESPAQ